ncbi:MAG: helix-turn-helix transcriptional regulator [Candidatus Eremiobacteraeota bacterium]|nr:helix-turn-helix transcriptional regulator [Candidatus Eremiobacteraeota bacterium]
MQSMERLQRFGSLLHQFRHRAGITQQDLAERANLSVEAISTLERGERRRPRPRTVASLALALHLAPDETALLNAAAGVTDRTHALRRQCADGMLAVMPQRLGDCDVALNLLVRALGAREVVRLVELAIAHDDVRTRVAS